MKIYLIRHAQTVMNASGHVFSGSTDTVLSEAGRTSAKRLYGCGRLAGIEQVYVTPLQRTSQTADCIFDASIPRIVLPEFAEIDFGEYEGRSAALSDDPIVQRWFYDSEGLTFPGGDNLRARAQRALDKLYELAHEGRFEEVAIISHATCIRTMLALMMTGSVGCFRSIPCFNCCVTLLETDEDGLKIKYINADFDH